ncbi:glycosyltransferase [Belliella sp. DSM 111904]|uniref:Glycosyltransferase n=1 Tax=Belliella filtrata TaxID=2923435 RepID=A0ABS9V339_9BACT|nr:glycosyltransferase [Belliella filtrata]MCH7410832.1 glycosyltransferase [Belliella filtrata]
MKVLHLQYATTKSGNYTKTLHDLMRSNGIDSKILSLHRSKDLEDDNIHGVSGKLPKIKSEIDIKIQAFLNRQINFDLGGFTFPILGTDVSKHPMTIESDVIYIHWALGGFLSIESWFSLAKTGKPIVFVLHDLFTFTGGCHYTFGCDKFKTACSQCQILQKSEPIDRAKKLFKKKMKFFKSFDNIYFISPSVWMKRQAESASLLEGKSIFQIYNSVSRSFKKLKNQPFRTKNLIKNETKVIGFGANYVNSPYKGFRYLLEALKIIGKNVEDTSKYEVLVFGGDLSKEILKQIPFRVHYTGYLSTEHEICEAYNSMDVFVVSSLEDNLPTTVLESLKCETPVVGFETGGVPEMIIHEKNGYLAKKFDSHDLANCIISCLESGISGSLNRKFSDSEIIENHQEVFEKIFQVAR